MAASVTMAITGCTTAIDGNARAAGTPQANRAESGLRLVSTITAPAHAKTYAGHPVYDACAIVNPDLLPQAGFEINPARELMQEKFTADDGPPAPGAVTYESTGPSISPEPASTCETWGKQDSDEIALSISQKQFESDDMSSDRESAWRNATNKETQDQVHSHAVRQETRGDLQIYVTMGTLVFPDEYQVYYFWGGDQYWATLTVRTGGDRHEGITRNPDDIIGFLTGHVADKLASGPDQVGLSDFRFGSPWNMPLACAVYKPEDWSLSFTNDTASARVKESSSVGAMPLTADAQDSGKPDMGPWSYVSSSCYRMNHAYTGDLSKQDGISVTIDTYNTVRGAAYDNHAQCSPDYPHPGAAPKAETAQLGDGDVCWVSTPNGPSDLVFKAGRHVVRMNAFNSADYAQLSTVQAVLGKISSTIAERLAQIP
ncbi:hypothetical protein OG943_08735 [Amycolatopsis sp. NBC_00345]|uniref:hypothetical protein n=1 Tax=Amycolatopsis sp. NBC_00345 TaxID=2975955 RepID=UPI002E25DB49